LTLGPAGPREQEARRAHVVDGTISMVADGSRRDLALLGDDAG
jgi:hypothetical protein